MKHSTNLKRFFTSIATALFACSILISCGGGDDDNTSSGDSNSITGKWKHIHWSDTINGHNITTEDDWLHKCDTDYDYMLLRENGSYEIVLFEANCESSGDVGNWEKTDNILSLTSSGGFTHHYEITEHTNNIIKLQSSDEVRTTVITYQKQ